LLFANGYSVSGLIIASLGSIMKTVTSIFPNWFEFLKKSLVFHALFHSLLSKTANGAFSFSSASEFDHMRHSLIGS
jgi:hypothetical protein